MPLRVCPEAKDEAWEIGVRMEVYDITRALRFDREWHAALIRIEPDPTSHPEHHMAVGPQVRYISLPGLPYIVLVRTTDPAETVVLSVLHNASGPALYRRAEGRR